MIVISLLLIIALVCFFLATVAIASPPRFQWIAAGLFFLTLWFALGGKALTLVIH